MTLSHHHIAPPPAPEIVRSAARGDERAWSHLVTRFEPVVRAALRRYRLTRHDLDDVVQTTWLRAFRHLGRLEDPASFGPWVSVTARREALRLLQRETPEVLTDEPPEDTRLEWTTGETAALDRERRAAVRASARRLPVHQRRLVDLLLDRPGISYEQISEVLDIPVGSIGPTRERALRRMRLDAALAQALD